MGRAGDTCWKEEKLLICTPEGRWQFGRHRNILKRGRGGMG